MQTLEQLIEKLDGVRVQTAGTGTIYVYHKGLKVRVADHEPNYGAPNRGNDKCFYTQDMCGKKFDIYDVVSDIADYLEIEIRGTLKGMMTKHLKVQAQLAEMAEKAKREYEAYMQQYNEQRAIEMAKLEVIVKNNKNEIDDIIARAEAYGNLGSNGDKRRKRTKNFFKNEFAAKFGFKANLVDVREIMSK